MAANLTLTATILPGTLHRETEFVAGLTGACGPNMLAMAWSWSTQAHHSTLETYQAMRAHGLCDANGTSTIGELRAAALLLGLPLADYRAYAEPWAADQWRAFFLRHLAAGHVVGYETANGQALVDALSGKGENARHLRYHFLLVVGSHPGGFSTRAGRELPAGWWCADGDNFAAGDVLQFYPDTLLAASQPCAALAIGKKFTMATNPYQRISGSDWWKDPRTGHSFGAGVFEQFAKPHGFPICTMTEHPAPGHYGATGCTLTGFGDPNNIHADDELIFWDATHGRVSHWLTHVAREYESTIATLKAQLAAQAASAPTASASEEAEKALAVVKSIKSQVASF